MRLTKSELRQIIREEIRSLNEGPLATKWRQIGTGKSLKVGPYELRSGGPGGVHDIYKNGELIGDFHLDRDGTEDWWVRFESSKFKDVYVKEIDDIIKHLQKNKI